MFPRAGRRRDGGVRHEVWLHLRGVFGDRGATSGELADAMMAAGSASGPRAAVIERLEAVLDEVVAAGEAGRRIIRDGERYRGLPG
jgi:hypothetical protein